MSHQPFPYDDIWEPVLRVIDAFGLDRCMWGTDWTRTIGMLTYEQGVAPFRDTKRLSESDKAALMGGTVQKVYKWYRHDPSPGGEDDTKRRHVWTGVTGERNR